MEQSEFTDLTSKERYDILYAKLCQEHELVNSRMKWLLSFQGFLFATMAISRETLELILPVEFYSRVLPLLGLCSTLFVLIGVVASRIARGAIRRDFVKAELSGYPLISPSRLGAVLGLFPSIGVPVLLILAWSFALNMFGSQ